MGNRRGQLGGNISGIIITILLIGILVGAGFFIFGEFLALSDDESFAVTNESGIWINSTGYQLAGTAYNPRAYSISAARNASDATTISSALYSVSSTGVITNATDVTFDGGFTANVDYTYLGGSSSYEAVNSTIGAFGTVPDLLPLIVLIAMVVIILGLVFTIPGARQGA